MKVSIGSKIHEGPWGGGNTFAMNLSKYLINNGHEVVFNLDNDDIDIILMTEPRKTSPSSAFTNYDVANYLKYKNPNTIVVHRVNECDEHKDTNFINKYITFANLCSDATIFVSTWIKDLYIELGNFSKKPYKVILAGSDRQIFNRNNFTTWDKSEKIKITTHHWSKNWKKGFEVYKYLDNLLNDENYARQIEFSFIGRLPDNVYLNNTKIFEPLSGISLATQLKKNHLYITGSLFEPSGNHHIEAAQCGLPVLFIDSGGIKEYCNEYGVEYTIENLKEKLDYSMKNYDNLIKKLKSYPGDSDKMSSEFLDYFIFLLENRNTLIKQRLKQKPTYFKDIYYKFRN